MKIKEFDTEPIYNEKYLKIKIKSYHKKINKIFHNTKIPKEDSQCIVYQQYLLIQYIEKRKYCYLQGKKIPKYVTDNIQICYNSDDLETILIRKNSDEEISDIEYYHEEIFNEEN